MVVDRGAVEAWTGDGRWLALRLPYLHVHGAVLTGGGEPARGGELTDGAEPARGGELTGWHLEPVQAPG